MDRGKIRNREQAQQIRDFSGLRWGTITPTDIDAFIEIHNKLFLFIEIKFEGKELHDGQRWALERLVDSIKNDLNAILIIAAHNEKTEVDIDAANCEVIKYRYRQKWIEPEKKWKLKEFCDWFIEIILGELPK